MYLTSMTKCKVFYMTEYFKIFSFISKKITCDVFMVMHLNMPYLQSN